MGKKETVKKTNDYPYRKKPNGLDNDGAVAPFLLMGIILNLRKLLIPHKSIQDIV